MVRGPQAGLAALAAAEADPAPAGDHRVDAVRAHLLELAGDRVGLGSSSAWPPAAPSASPNAAISRSGRARLGPRG